MVHLFRNTIKRTHIAVLGNPVRDAYLEVDAVDFPDRRVVLRRGATQLDIAYQGEVIRFGEKRYAQHDLGMLDLTGFTVRNGGGVYHTGKQIAHLCAQRHLPAAISAIDLVQSWTELAAAYQQLGIRHLSLGLEQPATNLVVTNGKPDRLILKSPDAAVQVTADQAQQLRTLLPKRLDLLVVNSLRSTDLAHVVIQHARQAGAAQYSVLTPSLSLEARIELQLRHDRASVCNLSEFALIAKVFGIPCPTQEESASLAEVAQAMVALTKQGRTGDLVVTLGGRGCLTSDRATGTLVHVGLRDEHSQVVQAQVRLHPERKNGVGDRFFGSFVLAHAFAKRGNDNRTAHAAHWASLEMVRQLAPDLTPDRDWVVAQPVAHSVGVRNSTQLRKTWIEKTPLQHRCVPAAVAVALR